ncbi:MAG: lipid-A-disaccharide synthase N-terminal domain-containing protein [Phycisphaerales bacterium]
MKWEPAALMVLLLLLGVWVAYDPGPNTQLPNTEVVKFTIGSAKGYLEQQADPSGSPTYRVLYRSGDIQPASGRFTKQQLIATFGEKPFEEMTHHAGNRFFQKLNVTSWGGVAWVVFGFAGQAAFSGRWLVQWFVSEKKKTSVVPISFWWLSLVGGVILFAYFAWRADLVAILGQTSGVVIYARNIRLRYKQDRREAAARAASQLEPKPNPQPATT